MIRRLFCLVFCLTTLLASAAVTEHPRLWLTHADLPRLRSWASASNPVFESGLRPLVERAKADMDVGTVPANDCGGTNWEAYPTEMYAELFAFMSLVDNDAAARADYASRARTLLMYVISLAALGPASVADSVCQGSTGYPPFRSPLFFTEDSNRARYHGEAFPLVVDWIYPSLSAADKQAIRGVFLRWSQEIIDRGYHHPVPVGLVNDPALLSERSQVRWAGNNYFTAHMRNLGLMALSFDAADDAGSKLRNYLGNATGAWLYLFDNLSRTDSQGGFLPEGFEYSPQTASYAIQFLLALRTAGADGCGSHCQVEGNPFWDDFLSAYYHSLSPATIVNVNGLAAYQPAWYGDAQTYATSDSISVLGALGVFDTVAGNTARLQSLRWAQTHTPPGGASELLRRVSNNDEFRNSLLYFMLFDPTAAPASDPHSQLALEHFAPGLNRLLARTSWDDQATWFDYSLSWSLVDHQNANGNQFEWYRKGEWLTKQRTGYADIAEGIASSEFSNTLALENDQPNRDALDWRTDLWQRGAQWNLVASGDPQLVAHSSNTAFTYATGDATKLYNSSSENVTDVLHASRSIVWLKPDAVLVYDRAQTTTANRFKRWWLQSATAASVSASSAVITTEGGQQLQVNSLLPAGATLSAVNSNEPHIEATVAGNEPMKVRLRIDAPGNPTDVRFLQVLQAADAGAVIGAPALIQSADAAWQGAKIGNTVVLFASTIGQTLAKLTYTFNTPVATHLITGLAANTAYCVTLTANSLSLSPGCSQLSDSGGVLQYPGLSAPPKTNQTIGAITFSPNTLTVGDTTTVSATASSNLPVIFASTAASVCSVSGSLVTGLAAGTCHVTGDQAGDATYAAAPQVAQDMAVAPRPTTSMALNPNSLNFAAQNVGSSSAVQTVILSNTGAATFILGSLVPSGDFNQSNDCSGGLGAGLSCTISVTFTPTLDGPRSGTLILTGNAVGSPLSLNLTGTGRAISAPVCTLSAVPAKVRKGGTSTLTATCNPAATSFTWTGGACAGNTTNTCIEALNATTPYSVTGTNSFGSDTATATVSVKPADLTPILMLLLD